MKRTIKHKKNLLKRWKKLKGCSICGYNNSSWALHICLNDSTEKWNYHMKNRNHYNSGAIRSSIQPNWNLCKIKEELKKCTVLCANHSAEQAEKRSKNDIS